LKLSVSATSGKVRYDAQAMRAEPLCGIIDAA
jgi:hypothetical protein